MRVRKNWASYSALVVLPLLGMTQALPATAQYSDFADQPQVETPWTMGPEAQPTGEDSETGIVQLTETEDSVLEDLNLSINFNQGDFVKGAAILPEANEAESPNASDLAQARFPNYRYSAGFDLPNFGWVRMDGRGVDSVLGVNIGLGVSYKKYFQPALPGQFTASWGVGTFGLILPYATIGGDYQWDNGWYVGGNVGGGLYYFGDDVTPFPVGYIGVGYRW
jgi:hypothetical protein